MARGNGMAGMRRGAPGKNDVGSYKSSPSGKGATAGIGDTSGGSVRELKRSTPVAGVVHIEGANRGGAATKNLDRSLDTDCMYEAPGLKELRAKQDRKGNK